jgi:hypothetical protein
MKIHKLLIVVAASLSFAYAGGLTLYSNDLGAQLSQTQEASTFGCSGDNVSPQLHWENAPKGTKSFAVTMYDPDAPTGSGWWHWVVFNIPSSVKALPSDFGNITKAQTIKAVQSITDFGKPGFGGACPPKGDKAHRYVVTLYALDVETLPLDVSTMPAHVGFMLNAHALQKATLVSYYQR